MSWEGQQTASLDFDAPAAEVQTALENLPNLAAGDVTVSGNAGGPYTLTWNAELGDVAAVELDTTELTASGTPGVTTGTQGQGNYNFVAAVNDVNLTFATANVSDGDTTL